MTIHQQESELIEKIKAGDTNAFRRFIEMHEKSISTVVISMLGNTEEAENVAQDVFIKFFYSIHKFRQQSTARTYLTRIAINLSLNELKKRKKRKNRLESTDNITKYENEAATNPDDFEFKEIIEQKLLELEKGQRAVFVLRIIEGYNTRETANILGIPEGTVLSRLHRSIELLKEKLKDYKYHC